MDTKEIFGRNLRNKLDEKHRSQNDLARYLKVTPTAVSRWVTAEALPRSNMIDRICVYLNCTAERVKDIQSQLVAQGKVLGGKVPFGYKIVDKHLVFGDNISNFA